MTAAATKVNRSPADRRVTAYRAARYIAAFLLAGAAVKFFIADSVLIRTDQMAPAILNGDRVLVFKVGRLPPLSWIPFPRHSPVIIKKLTKPEDLICLRTAARAGDIVSISSGRINLLNQPTVPQLGNPDPSGNIPAEYSPRDWLLPYSVPKKGEVLNLDTMSVRDFIFAWAVIQQENPDGAYSLKPWIQINDSSTSDYYITDFCLYRGPFDAIGPELSSQWFFWDKLVNYIQAKNPDNRINIRLGVMHYKVKHNYLFLAADNWKEGLDSRYTGPVSYNAVKGSVVCVLWSFNPDKKFPYGIRLSRTCRIILRGSPLGE
jgi:signal peptidase I